VIGGIDEMPKFELNIDREFRRTNEGVAPTSKEARRRVLESLLAIAIIAVALAVAAHACGGAIDYGALLEVGSGLRDAVRGR
jgi:hypothetical protein